jgi:hypothetical protein
MHELSKIKVDQGACFTVELNLGCLRIGAAACYGDKLMWQPLTSFLHLSQSDNSKHVLSIARVLQVRRQYIAHAFQVIRDKMMLGMCNTLLKFFM